MFVRGAQGMRHVKSIMSNSAAPLIPWYCTACDHWCHLLLIIIPFSDLPLYKKEKARCGSHFSHWQHLAQ